MIEIASGIPRKNKLIAYKCVKEMMILFVFFFYGDLFYHQLHNFCEGVFQYTISW